MIVACKELLGSVWAKGLNILLLEFGNGRSDDLLFLGTQLWVQGQHGKAGIIDAEIALKAVEENLSLLNNLLDADGLSHLLDGEMIGEQADTYAIAEHDGKCLFFAIGIRIRHYRTKHKHIEEVFLHILLGAG